MTDFVERCRLSSNCCRLSRFSFLEEICDILMHTQVIQLRRVTWYTSVCHIFWQKKEKEGQNMRKGLITKLMVSLSTVMASLALVVTSGLTNSTCLYFLYQPELPEGAEKLRRR